MAVAFYILRMLGSNVLFQRPIGLPRFAVKSEIIPHRQMAQNVLFIFLLKNMYLMGPFVTAFSQISPTRNTELSHIFITYGFKLALHPVHFADIPDDRHDVDDWFCAKSRHRSAADVINSCRFFS